MYFIDGFTLFFFIYNKLELEVFFLMNGLRLSWIVRNNNPIRDVILYNLREKLKPKAQL